LINSTNYLDKKKSTKYLDFGIFRQSSKLGVVDLVIVVDLITY